MGNCSSGPRLKANLRAFMAANPSNDGYSDEWYFDTMNVLLDRWAYSHVQFLRKKFLEATGDREDKELDKQGFFKLFGELQDMPKAVADSSFRMFDTDNSGKLNFREFCCALALCCHLMSSDDETIRFVFDMFDTNDDGLLSANDVHLLLEQALFKDDLKEDSGSGEKEAAALSLKKQQRIAEIKKDLMDGNTYLTFEGFYEWALHNLNSLHNLLDTFQIVPSPERERAICDEILSRHQALQEGSTWYCISHKWLQVWKAYVGWMGPSPGRRVPTNRGMQRAMSNAGRDHTASGESWDKDFRDDDSCSEENIAVFHEAGYPNSHHMSARPPEIDNSDLEGEHKGELKMNLVEHLDYELIPEEMWQKLVEWYGGGPAIPRKVICMGQDSQPQVELYPPLVLVVVAGESGQPLPQFSRRFFISRQSSLGEVLQMLAEKLSKPADRSRLWHRAKGEQWMMVPEMGVALDEFLLGKVWDAGAFMLETQTAAGKWPRDGEKDDPGSGAEECHTDRSSHRHFEVGDRVEAQSGVTNQWMQGTIVDVITRDHSAAPSQVKVHYDSTVYKNDEWISTSSDRLAPLDTHTASAPSEAKIANSDGQPTVRGATGLQNLGNTCFLNSTIQCIANTPLLREYFLSSQYLRDVNDRGIGCKGRLAEEFGSVMTDLWGGKNTALTPRGLKRTIDQFAPQFAGYEQHDAQELLAFFLDGLHEDLNRTPAPNAPGGKSGGSSRRDVGTPKLFSRSKPVRTMTGEASPKRGKAAWREKGVETPQSSATAISPPSHHEPDKAAGNQAALPDHGGDPTATKHTFSEGSTVSAAGSTSAPAVAGEIRLSAPAAVGVGRVPRGSAGVGGVSEFPSDRILMRSHEATAAEGAYIDDEDASGVTKKRSAERPAPPQPAQPRPPSMKNPVIEDDGTQWEDAPLAPTPSGAGTSSAEATVTDRSGMKTIEAAETPSNGTSTADMSRESTAERLPRANTAEQLARLNFPRNRFEALLQGGLSLTDPLQVPHPDVAVEDSKSKLPAGAAGAAVAAAAAARGGGGACDGSDDGVFSTSYNESEDFVPELLTPHRTSSRRSLNIFSWRRKRSDEDGSIPSSPSTKRRPRTPPTMMPLREEQPQPGDAVTSPTRRMLRGRKASIDAVPLAGVEGAGGHAAATSSGTHSSRTFLPWKGRQMQGPRDGSYDRRDEAENGPAQSVDARGGRAKEKESSWPSFLRRAKSRDSSAPRRTRPAASTRLPPPSHHGDLPIADAGAMVEEHSSNGSRTALRGRWVVSKDTEKSTASPSDEGDESGRLPTDGTSASDVQRAGNSKDSNGQSKAATERAPAASLGFPFLRAPWKSREPAVAMLGGSNNRKFVDFAESATMVAHGGAVVVEHRREWRPDCEASYPPMREPLREEVRRRDGRREGTAGTTDCGSSEGSGEARAGEASLPVPPRRESTAERSAGTGAATVSTKDAGTEDKDDGNSVESEEIPPKEDTAEDEDHLPDDEKAARQWERYRARNRSLVVDVFEGQLRSQLRCCSCGATSSTFEPFRYLSVPIPSNHVDRATLRVIFFPLPFSRSAGEERQQLTRFSVEVPKSSTVARVEKALSGRLPAPMSSVLLAEVYRSRIHRYLDSTLPLSDVRAEDQLFAFEVLQTPQELVEYQERHAPSRQRPRERGPPGELKKQPQQPRVLLIQAMHRRVVDVCRSDGRTWAQRREVFGLPFVMSAAASWNYATLHDMLMLHARRFLKPYSRRNQRNDHAPAPEERQVPFVARIVNASGTACGACDRRNCTGCLLPKNNSRLRLRAGLFAGATSAAKAYLALDWVDSTVYDQDYVDSVADDMTPPRSVTIDDGDDNGLRLSDGGCNASDEAAGAGRAGAGSVPISACVNAFAEPEDMSVEMGNGIHCKKCDKVVDAVKTLEVWREPDVLILHIKRFHFNGTHYEKLNTLVDLPYKELSLRPWIVGPSAATSTPYELYGAVCHWGGMSGGHYTSYCVNGEGKEPVWLKFNDEIVTSVNLSQERDEVARQCYVLFYRKKAFSSSNLINYSSLL